MTMKQRLRKLEAERAPHPAPVRYAWWDRSGPRPEAAPGEQLDTTKNLAFPSPI